MADDSITGKDPDSVVTENRGPVRDTVRVDQGHDTRQRRQRQVAASPPRSIQAHLRLACHSVQTVRDGLLEQMQAVEKACHAVKSDPLNSYAFCVRTLEDVYRELDEAQGTLWECLGSARVARDFVYQVTTGGGASS